MNNSVWLAILAAVFYGFGGPFMEYVHQSEVSTRDFIFVASLTTLMAAIFWPSNENLFSTLKTGKIVMVALIASIFLTAGFISLNLALSDISSLASVVFIISSTNPLMGSLISLFCLGENKKVILPVLLIGSFLTFVGAVMVVISNKNN